MVRALCRTFVSGSVQIQGEEVFEDLFVRHAGIPAVGGEDGLVELAMGVVKPGGTFVVEVRERSLLELLCEDSPTLNGLRLEE